MIDKIKSSVEAQVYTHININKKSRKESYFLNAPAFSIVTMTLLANMKRSKSKPLSIWCEDVYSTMFDEQLIVLAEYINDNNEIKIPEQDNDYSSY